MSSESRLTFSAAKALARRDRGMTAMERLAYLRWLDEHPKHAAVLARLEQTWRRLDALRALASEDAATASGESSAWRRLTRSARRSALGHHHGPRRCERWNRKRPH